MHKALPVTMVVLLVTGCAGDFRCPAKDGLGCVSLEEVYTNKGKTNKKITENTSPVTTSPTETLAPRAMPGSPIRTDPRILRLYFAPWEDEHGNLHDESYTYLTLDTGRWILRANKSTEFGNAGLPVIKGMSSKKRQEPVLAAPSAGPAIVMPETPAAEKLTLTPLPESR